MFLQMQKTVIISIMSPWYSSMFAFFQTRMHSSRMHTGCSLTVCQSLLPGGSAPREVCSRGGSAPREVSAPRGCLLQGCLLLGGLLPGGVCSWGVSALGGGSGMPPCTEADPSVNRMTDTSKNITLATTLLHLVKRKHSSRMLTARLLWF